MNLTGTTESLTIPTRFKVTASPGWRPSTPTAPTPRLMTGPPSCSTAATYSPSYEKSSIRLLKELLSPMRENTPLTLTFHFWSGFKVTYEVTRSGDTVTGKVS
ncbi:hypothetical protein [Nonomuraea sp. NPDC050786]|uniref:hypothetical protein n=1 Tax=Nonomuraea sp. NPDC050786 TaxID=3154840 RepID=UPI00340E5854